ncbi:hypothetical protein SOVF_052170 isoform A [Spinacia oleracea]|uniref:Uncharacterized protein isoform X2 n=1 Tax=Spinacia oleracea TaxID=3562 RepID=A0A9R0IDV9_SPIOL|nr:uncharacterized protein LOC110787228 isoform X2 [Spinacia oleracea]KNA20462.1 hypothetical protein SOVF_052170 isoform A [Spinacia oleracea]
MADGGERKGVDFYKVLGLEKECSPTDLKTAYRNLAKRWHPDRCSASGNLKFVEEAKKKFQGIQEAYSVLSDESKRFLYDVGVYDNDDDENNHGMGDFLNEMVTMMSEHKPTENGEESFEQLQDLFDEMFQRDNSCDAAYPSTSSQGSCSFSNGGSTEGSCINNKRNSLGMNATEASSSFNNINSDSFCLGTDGAQGRFEKDKGNKRKNSRKRL